MINIEICINSDRIPSVRRAASAAYHGGATTIELCSAMALDGLTPPAGHIAAARTAFPRPGLMVMIRPRGGGFCYTAGELERMIGQIGTAGDTGADGVVFGVLGADRRIDRAALDRLVAASQRYGLRTTFHRAFDATPDPDAALDAVIASGGQRILTSGIPWGEPGTALNGAERLARLARRAAGRVEIVIGGGVTPANVARILARMPRAPTKLAVHAYSGVQQAGVVTPDAVRALVDAASAADRPADN